MFPPLIVSWADPGPTMKRSLSIRILPLVS